MQTVTLQAHDFKTIHNTLCELRSLARGMNHRMVKVEEVEQIICQFEQGLANAYEQDSDVFGRKMKHFGETAEQDGLQTVWSIYEVDDINDPHPYPSDAFVVYGDRHYPVEGTTWRDVWTAADRAIRDSGDLHHIFIEGFDVQGNELHMYTGS